MNSSKNYDQIFVVEMNRDGQLHQLLSLAYPEQVPKLKSVAFGDGMPASAKWIREGILEQFAKPAKTKPSKKNLAKEKATTTKTAEERKERSQIMSALPMAGAPANVNLVGLVKSDYRGNPTTLCQGCGHNSISNQIISAMYEMNVLPEKVIKFSGIGCSSKSPTYFMNRSFGFNSLHGRMPSIATGALFGDHTLKGIGVSGDGDSASIGMGQFKHVMRRNLNLVYIIENNGVYGLTKGQFSATAEKGLHLKSRALIRICLWISAWKRWFPTPRSLHVHLRVIQNR